MQRVTVGDADEKTAIVRLRLVREGAPHDDDGEDDEETSSVRERPHSLDAAIADAVRAALELACAAGERISVVIRGDATRGLPLRTIDGTVGAIIAAQDGRARVVIEVAEGCSQIVLVDRVVRVMSAK